MTRQWILVFLWPAHQNKEDSEEWYWQRSIVPCTDRSFATEKRSDMFVIHSESTELQPVVDLSLKQFTSAAEMTKDFLSESWKENSNQDTWTHERKTDANGWFLKGTTTAFKSTNRQEWFGLKEKEAFRGGRYRQAIGPDQSFVYISKPSCSSLFCEHTKRKPISNWYPHIAKCCSKRKLVETNANLRKLTQTYVRKFTEKQYLCTTKRTQAVHNER